MNKDLIKKYHNELIDILWKENYDKLLRHEVDLKFWTDTKAQLDTEEGDPNLGTDRVIEDKIATHTSMVAAQKRQLAHIETLFRKDS